MNLFVLLPLCALASPWDAAVRIAGDKSAALHGANFTHLGSWLIASHPIERGEGPSIFILVGDGDMERKLSTEPSFPLAGLCVPPKAGMMAAKTVFWRGTRNIRDLGAGRGKKSQSNDPASKPEWALAAIGRYLLDKNATRVAIVRDPVERVLSSLRAFGARAAGCKTCHQGTTPHFLDYAKSGTLRRTMNVSCAEAKYDVNQHFRSQRCFCGFDLDGMRARTHVLKHGSATDMASLEQLLPDTERWRWNERKYGRFKNLTGVEFLSPQHAALTTSHRSDTKGAIGEYDPEVLRLIEEAVLPDIEFFGFERRYA